MALRASMVSRNAFVLRSALTSSSAAGVLILAMSRVLHACLEVHGRVRRRHDHEVGRLDGHVQGRSLRRRVNDRPFVRVGSRGELAERGLVGGQHVERQGVRGLFRGCGPQARAGLRVRVVHDGPAAPGNDDRGDVDAGRGLRDPALGVGYGDAHSFFSFATAGYHANPVSRSLDCPLV